MMLVWAKRKSSKVMLIAIWCLMVPAWSIADEVTVRPSTNQTTFFADDDVEYQLELSAASPVEGLLQWQLKIHDRTLSQGDLPIKVGPAKTTEVIRLRFPHVKGGVIQKASLTASFKKMNHQSVQNVLHQVLWVYPPDAFVDRHKWLEQLELNLYDPIGETTKVFETAKIPFNHLRSLSAMDNSSGMIVIGEGISLRRKPSVATTVSLLASSGRSILWFAPSEGSIEFPGGEQSEIKRPKKFVLRGSDMIVQLDKRLDANAWSSDPKEASVAFQVVALRGRTHIDVVEPTKGWTWVLQEFEPPEGKLILCGLQLTNRWDASPTPRFMLLRLLEYLHAGESNDSKNEQRDDDDF